MRRLLLLLFFLPNLASAQIPRFEVFGGYSYLRSPGLDFNGWNAAATWNFSRFIGFTGDFDGHYWSQHIANVAFGPITFRTRIHSFSIGPTVAVRNHTRFTPFGHFLAGGTRFTGSNTIARSTTSSGVTRFNLIGGGGIDVALRKRWALRPIQLDYHAIDFEGAWRKSMRYSAGVVVRLGTG